MLPTEGRNVLNRNLKFWLLTQMIPIDSWCVVFVRTAVLRNLLYLTVLCVDRIVDLCLALQLLEILVPLFFMLSILSIKMNRVHSAHIELSPYSRILFNYMWIIVKVSPRWAWSGLRACNNKNDFVRHMARVKVINGTES